MDGILNNTQLPHQPFCVVQDQPTFPGTLVFREIIRRALLRDEKMTVVGVLNPPSDFLPRARADDRVRLVDLSESVVGYTDSEPGSGGFAALKETILSGYTGGQVFIEAGDVLGSDYSSAAVVGLVRDLLSRIKVLKAPARLVLLLPAGDVLAHVCTPTFTPTLSWVRMHHPGAMTYLSKMYLSPMAEEVSANLWMVLERAGDGPRGKGKGRELGYRGEEGVEVGWHGEGHGVGQVLVRKSVGGIKAIQKSLCGFVAVAAPGGSTLSVVPLTSVVDLTPFASPPVENAAETDRHGDLDLSFKLSLTDKQRRERDAVPLPYVHEGEGASGELVWEDEEESDDEEI